MSSNMPRSGAGSLPTPWVLLVLATMLAAIAAFVGITTALGFAHADVRGLRLTGWMQNLFLAGLAVAVLGASASVIGLRRRHAWAVPALASVWPVFALVCLVIDRMSPAPGPGRPLWFYVIAIGLLPAAVTVLLGRRVR